MWLVSRGRNLNFTRSSLNEKSTEPRSSRGAGLRGSRGHTEIQKPGPDMCASSGNAHWELAGDPWGEGRPEAARARHDHGCRHRFALHIFPTCGSFLGIILKIKKGVSLISKRLINIFRYFNSTCYYGTLSLRILQDLKNKMDLSISQKSPILPLYV